MPVRPCKKCGSTEKNGQNKNRGCAPCRRAKNLRWRRKKNTGWTPEAFEKAWTEQNGLCAICKRELQRAPGRVASDHKHATRITRALLCMPCNCGLGLFKDDPERLREAARYLELY